MKKIQRYLIAEILGPLALGFIGYTFILMMQFLFQSAEMIIRRGVPAEIVGQLLLLSLPNMVVLTIPMSLLFAILVAIGKLASTNELTALRASGVSLLKLYRPILALSLLLTAINSLLMVRVLPWGNSQLQELRLEIIRSSISKQVEPRVFYQGWEGLVVYVFETRPSDGLWQGVFMADTLATAEAEVTLAETGRIRVDERSGDLVLDLEDAWVHKVDLAEPGEYHLSRHQLLQRRIDDLPDRRIDSFKGLRELTIPELMRVLEEPNIHPARYNLAKVEIHKKFSIPACCFVFALIGLPLGFNQRRGGRASGFALSVVIIMAYYVMLNNGEEAARVGTLSPAFAMWLPNLVFFLLGLFLLVRRNSDRRLLASSERWFNDHLWRFMARLGARGKERRSESRRLRNGSRSSAESPATDVVIRFPRLRLRFPNTMDRYIVRSFFKFFGLVLLSTVSLMLIADLTERTDVILENEVGADIVLAFYKFASLQIAFEVAPIAVLITVLVTFGLLSRTNEIVAAKSLGMSLFRLSVPALVCAALVTMAAAALEERVLPATNQRAAELNDEIRGRPSQRSYRRADRNWLFGQNRYIYNYLRYDEREQSLQRLQVFEIGDSYELAQRLFADNAKYLGEAGWRFDGAWKRSFVVDEDGRVTQSFSTAPGPVVDDFPERPDYFESDFKLPNAMDYGQLERYIEEIQRSGQAVPELEVELYNKIGYPATCLVMALVALPFSFRLGRRGALYGIGIGVILGIVFMGLFAFTRTLGEVGALPPLLAVWSPGLVFALLSLYMFLGVET